MTICMEENNSVVIVDSSALFAIEDLKDSTHQKALEIYPTIPADTQVIIPAEIFAETVNTVWKKLNKKAAIDCAKKILSSTGFTILESSHELRLASLNIFENLQSKNISFTDCLVMAFAKKFKTKFIFGFDEGFKKNGFKRLGID